MSVGRPKKIIDYEAVAKLAHIQCTVAEIANFFDCSTRTLERDSQFCRIYKKEMDGGKMSLRRKQWKAADEGNTTMLVWLGKQYLGQRDKTEMDARIYTPKHLSDFYVNPKSKKDAKQKANLEPSATKLLEDASKK